MLKPKSKLEIPEETNAVTKEASLKGNAYLAFRNELCTIFEDEIFSDLYPNLVQPAESPARLVMVTLMQFMENLQV